jgi:hypothetical protein
MRSCRARISTEDDKPWAFAARKSSVPGLVITQAGEGEGWKVTHRESGCSVAPTTWGTPEAAEHAATTYLGHLDWRKPLAGVLADDTLKDAAGQMWAEGG